MDEMDKTFVDVDELAKKIEERIHELENEKIIVNQENEYSDDILKDDIGELSQLIESIDKRIRELEEQELSEVKEKESFTIDLDYLTEKVNEKLDSLSFEEEPKEDLERTLYDLTEISRIINETMEKLERQKEMYCDMARKKAYKEQKEKRKQNNKNKK